MSVVNDLKGIYFGDCIIKTGLHILGEQKFDDKKFYRGLNQEYIYQQLHGRQRCLSVVNVLKGIYFGDCILGIDILGGTKVRRQKVLQGAKPGVYIAGTTWTATMFVCSKRSKRDLFWGLYNKKGLGILGGTKVHVIDSKRGLKQECI